ncbi:Zinc finger, CCHC-type [Gossypium australe]|uniref:Zinc finger, CCHC-type n=1 Tax=Gossypium australe TaxID=47621 RepID=A0A5B6V7Q9_9ROSI|nr:Zinc finger, CCHC-type [Gossypium australe]
MCRYKEDGEELVKYTFAEEDAAPILRILLASSPHEDFLARGGEASGEFSVRSAYKLLQNTDDNPRAYALQTSYRKLYKKLWLLNLPRKIKITIWKITWNFLPTRVNLQHKKLVADPSCSRCGERAETIDHLFRECPVTVEICALWAIWGDRNSRVHNKKVSTGTEIRNFIKTYLAEIDGLEGKKSGKIEQLQNWNHPPQESVKINFDGAFDGRNNISASAIVVRDNEGSILFSWSKIHKGVQSVFAAETLACREAVKIRVEHTWPKIYHRGGLLNSNKKVYRAIATIGLCPWIHYPLGVRKIGIVPLLPLGCVLGYTIRSSFEHCNETQNSLVKFHKMLLLEAVNTSNNQIDTTKGSLFFVLDLYNAFKIVFNRTKTHKGK